MKIKYKMKKFGLKLQKHSPTILSVLAAGGVIGTAILAVKNGRKADKIRDQIIYDRYEDYDIETLLDADIDVISLNTHDKMEIASAYIPTISLAAGTIICIFGANALNKRNQAMILSAYEMMRNSYNEYRKSLIDLYGEETDKKVVEHMACYKVAAEYHQQRLDTPDEKLMFLEPNSGFMFEAYEREVMDAEYHFNRNFTLRGYATLNELWGFLNPDIPPTEGGDEVGWDMASGILWVDFEHRLIDRDDQDVFVIDTVFPPDIINEMYQ